MAEIKNPVQGQPIYAKDILNTVYPVGSIYMSVNNTSPESFIGGTWVALQDRFLVGAGSSYTNGATGGEASHTLTVEEMPNHRHGSAAGGSFLVLNSSSSADPALYSQGFSGSETGWWYKTNKNIADLSYEGDGKAHNNLPPYLAVYMWKRTA